MDHAYFQETNKRIHNLVDEPVENYIKGDAHLPLNRISEINGDTKVTNYIDITRSDGYHMS
jgi:hypothetical protein